MIQLLATRYQKHIACFIGLIFYLSIVIPSHAAPVGTGGIPSNTIMSTSHKRFLPAPYNQSEEFLNTVTNSTRLKSTPKTELTEKKTAPPATTDNSTKQDKPDIDGPSQPEMSSFKSVGTSDMVNLFSGDFSYNIPLMDVGGYPINIFYDGGISMEQEASWVGLGWNINPGNISRNMRGVPDDFNGTEKSVQDQNMKPNKTWGVSLGGDVELVGIKSFAAFSGSLGGSLGISVNNYLGPALELSVKGTTSFKLGGKSANEKAAPGMSLGLSANLSSRSGLSLTPNVSFSANLFKNARYISTGVGLSTSYNSRSGIKSLQLYSQMSANYDIVKGRNDKDKVRGTEVNKSSMGASILSSSISFSKPSYVPSMRSVITNKSGAGRFQLGLAMFGFYGSLEVEGYGQVSKIASGDQHMEKPMVGYLYSQNAKNNRNAVMDFSRFNENEVTPATPVISVPQYAYDVFSIQGEGTGGTIRAYRNDMGYVRDNYTASKDDNWSAGVDVGIPGHVGANFNTVKSPSTISEWNSGNKLRNLSGFTDNTQDKEASYFRNPGENTVVDPAQFDMVGGTDMVRYKLGGTNSAPSIEPTLQRMDNTNHVLGEVSLNSTPSLQRKKRTQVVSYLTADEATNVGLDNFIKSYWAAPNFLNGNKLGFDQICRNCGDRKGNHISQFNVTEADGKRYVYGLPVYNIVQQDYTFSVANSCQDCDQVPFTTDDASLNSSHINSGIGGKDGYTQITSTPPYAHSFLLTGLLSPDYVDVTGDGITEDDLGGAVKFNYTKYANHKWRTPHTSDNGGLTANSNPGHLTEVKDDKGLLSYGERESWYLQSVESKTMIAVFTLEDRNDGKGFSGPFSGVNGSDQSLKKLSRIDLYSKADLKKNGIAGAKPIKTARFEYDYSLCSGTTDNTTGQGKLTLKRIWFEYNGQPRANKNQYVFSYTAATAPAPNENPAYEFNGTDRWGNFKPAAANPDGMKNRDYPYVIQDKTTADQYARAWNLKRILLPSGGQIEVDYESDDYAFVQNKRAAGMYSIIGFSNSPSTPVANLYNVNGTGVTENDYVFIKVPVACASAQEVAQKYLQDFNQLAFKLAVYMPKGGYEYIPTYATVKSYGVYTAAGFPAIWIQLNTIRDKGKDYSPLSVSAIEYLREQLPGQAFPGYDVSESSGLEQLENMFNGWFTSIRSAFSRIPDFLRENHMAQSVNLNRSFVRLTIPTGIKYGGGQRVKTVRLKDNWNKMTGQYTSVYGQEYDYTTTETFNGAVRTISSGVASYEPSMGGDENPFQSVIQVSNEIPLGPTSYGAIEMPVLDAFFPAPSVGYSKVTVTSIGKKQNPDPLNKKTRSGVGRQVTEFYTAKDFPVYYNYTSLDPSTDKTAHVNPSLAFFYKYAFDSRALSQGFLVSTNDMHGKMKSQSSYAENDPNTRINYTENFYRNTGGKGFNEKFDFVYNSLGGEVRQGNMGIDIELMTDTREFAIKTNSFEIQAQVDWMLPPPFPLWLPFIWPVVSKSENNYRAVTTTKVINYHSVLDSVVVIDKGSQVSTKNLVYDAETGQVIVNRTNNEFDKPIYSVNNPAYWAYSGMGLAYKNIDAVYSGVNFLDGKIIAGMTPAEVNSLFESGDELYIIDPGTTAGCDPLMASPGGNILIWALDTAKNTSSLTNPNPSFIFIDKQGKPYSRTGVKFRIIRSGHRNMLGASLAGVTLMANPVVEVVPGTRKLVVGSNSKVINATAVEYKEKWQTDNEVFKKYQTIQVFTNPSELVVNGNFSAGNTNFSSNYSYCNTNPSPGCYRVASNSSGWFPTAPNCGNHTPGGGNFMQIDGGNSFNTVWYQTVTVTPNTLYNFSAYICSINEVNTPTPVGKIQFLVNGAGISPVFSANVGPCNWKQVSVVWNSGSNTSVTIGILNIEWSGAGNDYGIDDISFIANQSCSYTEIEDCGGYLEKSINPYSKGLLGNFKGYRNMVFYGERNESDPLTATNLPVNGFLKDFALYWTFNGNNNLVPDLSPNSKWVWNSQSTRFNAKGLELETKDALGIYTSAQYGYRKTIPVAIASNSRAEEMFYEGFEDYLYDETLNGATYNNCAKGQVDFSFIPPERIVKAESLGFRAHTGKYVMQVNDADTMRVSVADPAGNSFNLQYQPATSNSIQALQPNTAILYNCGDQEISNNTITGINSTNTFTGWCDDPMEVRYYFRANSSGFYSLESFMLENAGGYTVTVSLVDDQNPSEEYQVYSFTQPYSTDGSSQNYVHNYFDIQVCSSKYYIVHLYYHPNPAYYNTWPLNSPYWCGVSTTSAASLYAHLQLLVGSCNYTLPVQASSEMMNPVFTVPANKKMVFSAWVKETCGNPQGGVPCTLSSYANNEVQIDFGGAPVVLKPSGPVIEGWQRYEGYFTTPGGTGTMNLKFVNNSGSPVYFDDIRIHPFNSNVKSYVYDPVNLRLTSELDANNYASFYEYDEEGTLIRTKVETREGVKTVTESRSAKQKNITDFQ